MKTAATSHIKFPGMNAKEGLAPLLAWWQAVGQVESILWFDCQGDIPPGPYGREEKDLNLPLKVTRQSGVVSQWHRAPQTGRDPEVSSPKGLQIRQAGLLRSRSVSIINGPALAAEAMPVSPYAGRGSSLSTFPSPLVYRAAVYTEAWVTTSLNSASLAQAYDQGWVQVATLRPQGLDFDALHSIVL